MAKYLTAREIADQIGVTRQRVWALVDSGHLPPPGMIEGNRGLWLIGSKLLTAIDRRRIVTESVKGSSIKKKGKK